MLVHLVVIPGSGARSWTVLGDDDVPVVPVDRFLAYLTDIGRSPNTVKAYAHDLKDLGVHRVPGPGLARGPAGGRRRVRRLAAASPGGAGGRGRGAAVVGAGGHRGDRQPQARRGERVLCAQARTALRAGDLLAAWRTGGRGGWKPFLHHVSKGKPYRGRAISLKVPQKLPRILTVAETQAILDACTRLRDRFFFALMHESGCRAGEALGLRHEDIAAAEQEISRAAGEREPRKGQVRRPDGTRRGELIRLYADYLHYEYGSIDSDYVSSASGRSRRGRRGRIGRPMTWCCGCGRGPAWTSTRTGSGTFSLLNDRVAISSGVPCEL